MFRLDMSSSHTPVQAISSELRDNDFAYDYDADILTRLFFASPRSIAFFRRYREVLAKSMARVLYTPHSHSLLETNLDILDDAVRLYLGR